MFTRGSNLVSSSYGAELNRAKTALTTKFIHFSDGQNTTDKIPNYGNIGESTFEFIDRTNGTTRPEFMANAPWIIGEQASPFESTALYFSGEATETAVMTMMDVITNTGALLFFGRVKITNNSYIEGLWSAGKGFSGSVSDQNIYLQFNNANGDLELKIRAKSGVIQTITVMDTAGVPAGGAEHQILLLVDMVNLQTVCRINNDNETTVTGLDAADATGLTSITTSGMSLTMGDIATGTTSGARTTTGNNYLGGDWRDFSFFNVTTKVDQIVTNFAAIAAAFAASPEGYIPNNLKALIE